MGKGRTCRTHGKEKKNEYRILAGKSKPILILRQPRLWCMKRNKWDLGKLRTEFYGLNSSEARKRTVEDSGEHGNKSSGSKNIPKFLSSYKTGCL
jgi:hypothetical protein